MTAAGRWGGYARPHVRWLVGWWVPLPRGRFAQLSRSSRGGLLTVLFANAGEVVVLVKLGERLGYF